MMDAFAKPGTFMLGCNYWASHAGTSMWSDWQPDVVDHDFKILAEQGVRVLRVFPLWTDFQPIEQLFKVSNRPEEFRHGETKLGDTEAGKAGISEEAYAKFEQLVQMAESYGIQLIVGLVTGWMSGRMFVPVGLRGRNLLTDPLAIKWEVRFVKHFVKHFRKNEAIIGWDLGNECNCMGPVTDRDSAWLWTSIISNAIKTEDQTRPVISGMHGLTVDEKWHWRLDDQAELTDVLTTHPYPLFTPHAKLDPMNSMRTILHATTQTRFYEDVGGKRCFVEEQGSLGPMFGDDQEDADFMRTNLFSLYAHDCGGMLWWCNHDQYHLEQAPYDWIAMETELGLFRSDHTPKPVVKEIAAFDQFLKELPIDTLPSRMTDGVCIVSQDQDQWGVAYSAFTLAKQAGRDIEFQYAEQPLKDAAVYLLPSISGTRVISKHRWLELMGRVEEGAVLYISYNDGFLGEFEKNTGLRVHTQHQRKGATQATFLDSGESYPLEGTTKLVLHPSGAKVLAEEADGNPMFSRYSYGKGTVYFLNAPLEMYMNKSPGRFDEGETPYWKFYEQLFATSSNDRILSKSSPMVGVTEHPLDEERRIAILINYSSSAKDETLSLASDWKLGRHFHGPTPNLEDNQLCVNIMGNHATMFEMIKR